MYVVEGSS